MKIDTLISPEYRKMNRFLHENLRSYGRGGHRWASKVPSEWEDILDYGCGKGTLRKALVRPIAEYDPAIPGKDGEPDKHDYVVCTDVLEHIEPEYLTDVLRHIASTIGISGLLVVATRPANKALPDGRNAHLLVRERS